MFSKFINFQCYNFSVNKINIVVITSISQYDSFGINKLLSFLMSNKLKAVIVADKKTPAWPNDPHIDFLSINRQMELWPKLAIKIPFNHYSRKNLGYLRAVSLGATSILDTDDDNYPTSNPWDFKSKQYRQNVTVGWLNVYRYFAEKNLWPRGLPLRFVNQPLKEMTLVELTKEIACFQSIVDLDPDIDAIGRMLFPEKVIFSEELPVILGEGICPTNSQATIWSSWVLPLLYLPSTATFRMTDIWRGLIAQTAIQAFGGMTVFGKLGFEQIRNEHDLNKDFESEVSGHLHSEKVSEISKLVWSSGSYSKDTNSILAGMNTIYSKLASIGIIDPFELEILAEWEKCINKLNVNR